MANGTYATKFTDLDIGFDSLPSKPQTSSNNLTVQTTDAVRSDDSTELVVNSDGTWMYSSGLFKEGPYKNVGFMFVHIPTKSNVSLGLKCAEYQSLDRGIFCEKIMGLKDFESGMSYRLYPM